MATSCRRSAILAMFAMGVEGFRMKSSKKAGSSVGDCFSKYDGMALLRLSACPSFEKTESLLREAGCYMLDEPKVEQLGCTDAEVVCKGNVEGLLKADVASMVSADAGALWRGESGVTHAFTEGFGVASDFYSNWRDLATQDARVKSLVDSSSSGATLEVAGKSLEGRDMNIVRIRGQGYSPGKPRVFLTFNLHAREWITGMAGVYTVEQLLRTADEDFGFFNNTEVVIMPMANPDGFLHSTVSDRMHRKNMRSNAGSSCLGADLNRNFAAHWGQGGSSTNPCSDTFMGPSAMSEPESNVIAQVMEEAPMSVYIDTHSYTELVITSPAWTYDRSPRHDEYRAVGQSIQSAMYQPYANKFQEGPVSGVLYIASGGTIDYADDRNALGICLELRPPRWGGGGFAPSVSEILPAAVETYEGVLAAIRYAQEN